MGREVFVLSMLSHPYLRTLFLLNYILTVLVDFTGFLFQGFRSFIILYAFHMLPVRAAGRGC
jgi:hypothetical protein